VFYGRKNDDMTVTFDVSEMDLLRLFEHHANTSRTNRKVRLSVGALTAVTLAWAGYVFGGPIQAVGGALLGVVLVMGLYRWGGPQFNRAVWRRQIREGKGAGLGPQTVSMDAEGVRAVSARSEGLLRWAGIDRIEEDAEYFYFMLSMAGLAIPKRAFVDGEQAQAFIGRARDYHRGAVEQRDAADGRRR
jgi:hypothetical protein